MSNFTVRWIFYLFGIVLIGFSLAVQNASYAEFLIGDTKDLSFGPTLFRVLLFFHGSMLLAAPFIWRKAGEPKNKTGIYSQKTENGAVFWSAVALLTGFAFVLRLGNLNSDLWTDEVFTLLDFARKPFGEILTSFPSQNQHLLYSLLARTSIRVFGESAWALRLPAVIFGAGSVPALFLLCRKLLDAKAALLAAALLTVSYHHIWFSQNARGYTGLLFFTLLATWTWLEALERNEWRWWLFYAAALVGGMWIHMTMAFVAAAQALMFLAFLALGKYSRRGSQLENEAGWRPFAAWILSAALTLQLYALALPDFLNRGLHEESNNSEWTNPLWVLTEIWRNLSIGFAGFFILLLGGFFLAIGWREIYRKNRRAAFIMTLPPVMAGGLILAAGHNLFPRFFFFAMGFGLIFVVAGALALPKYLAKFFEIFNFRTPVFNSFGYLLACLLIAVSVLTLPRNYALPKQDFTGARNYVEKNRQAGEKIVAVRIAGEIYSRYFAPEWNQAKTESDLKDLERTSGGTWLVYTLSPEIKAFRPQLWQAITSDYETVKIFPGTLNGGEIYVCRRRTSKEVEDEPSRNKYQTKPDFVRQNDAYIK